MTDVTPPDADTPNGLEFVTRAFAAGGFARGIGRTMGMKGKSVEFGKVTVEGFPTEDYYNPLGTVHGGYAATILDAAIALAVHSTLPAGVGYATLDLKVTYLRAMTKDSSPIIADATVIHQGKRVVASEARLVDRDGKLCAHATATCMTFPAADGVRGP